jgi:hypothetical protein
VIDFKSLVTPVTVQAFCRENLLVSPLAQAAICITELKVNLYVNTEKL